MRHVLKLGPLSEETSRSLYAAFREGTETVTLEADSDLEGLRGLQARGLGPLTCEPELSAAAAELGLPVADPPEDALLQRAVVAVMTVNPLLPAEVVPALVEFFEVFRDFLEFQPWLAMGEREVLKVQLTKPLRTWEATLRGGSDGGPGLSLCPIRGVLSSDVDAESLFALATLDRPGLGRALTDFIGEPTVPFFVRIEKGHPSKFTLRDFLTLTAALDACTRLALGEEAKGFAGEGKLEVTAKAARLEEAPAPKEQASEQKVPRNAPCPCGSGMKYKKCHEGQPLPSKDPEPCAT